MPTCDNFPQVGFIDMSATCNNLAVWANGSYISYKEKKTVCSNFVRSFAPNWSKRTPDSRPWLLAWKTYILLQAVTVSWPGCFTLVFFTLDFFQQSRHDGMSTDAALSKIIFAPTVWCCQMTWGVQSYIIAVQLGRLSKVPSNLESN